MTQFEAYRSLPIRAMSDAETSETAQISLRNVAPRLRHWMVGIVLLAGFGLFVFLSALIALAAMVVIAWIDANRDPAAIFQGPITTGDFLQYTVWGIASGWIALAVYRYAGRLKAFEQSNSIAALEAVLAAQRIVWLTAGVSFVLFALLGWINGTYP